MVPEMSDKDVMTDKILPTSSHSPYTIYAVPERKEGNSSSIVISNKKLGLITATATTTAVVKKEDIANITIAVKSLYLSPKAVTTLKAFLREKQTACCVYTKDLQNLVEMQEPLRGED